MMMAMKAKGIRICIGCNSIGPKGFYCRSCVKTGIGMINRNVYADYDQCLEKGEGVCFNGHKIWKENTVRPHCCASMVARLPIKEPGVFYLFDEYEKGEPLFATSETEALRTQNEQSRAEALGRLDVAVEDKQKGPIAEIEEISTEQGGTARTRDVDPIIKEMMKDLSRDVSCDINEVLAVMDSNECDLVQSTLNKYNWLLDSGATVHVTNNKRLLVNARKTKQFVKVGNGADSEATYIGEVDMIVEDNKRLRLMDVLFIPGFIRNVISLSKIVRNGVTVELHNGFVKFKTGNKELKLQKAGQDSMWTITSTTKRNETKRQWL
jgi:hypothetical protein